MPNEKERIVAEYHSAVGAYQEAVRKMSGLLGEAFEEAKKRAEKAREVCEEKRALLDRLDHPNDG